MTIVRRVVAAALVLTMLSSCATILYPERRGNKGGAIDVVPLVVDILLFIPGLIPGVIAIVVDFGTGAIYTGGGGKKADLLEVGPAGEIALRRPQVDQATAVELRLVDEHGAVLSRSRTTWEPGPAQDAEATSLSVSMDEAMAVVRSDAEQVPMFLEVVVEDGQTARYPISVHRQPLEDAGDPLPLPMPALAAL